MKSVDLFQIGGCRLYFTIRFYMSAGQFWGSRKLGNGRFALDFGKIALRFERYW